MNLPFEQLSAYEKPMLLMTQALDNELTVKGALQTLVDVDGLSPQERDLFTDRLKERVGRNPFTDTVIDVVTNPFVLLMAVTNPVAGQALSRTGKAIFDVGERFSPLVKEQGGMHSALGMLAPMQKFQGTALTPAVQAFTKGVDRMEREMLETVGEPLRKVLERHGLETLNFERITDPAKKDVAKRIGHALWVSLEGLDKETKTVLTAIKGGELKLVEKTRPRYVVANMDEELGRLGARELRDAFRNAQAQRRIRLFGDDAKSAATGTFVPDEQKILRIWQGLRYGFKDGSATKGSGKELAAMMLGPDVARAIEEGLVSQDHFRGMVRKVIENQPTNYMPRNLIDMKGARNVADVMEQRRSRSLVATGSSISRTATSGQWDPDDMEDVFRMFGSTEDGEKALAGAKKRIKKILDRGDVARTYRINTQESMSRYFRDTGVTHSLYVQTVDEVPRLAQRIKDTRGMAKVEKVRQLDAFTPSTPIMDGRKSIASVLHDDHFLLEDRFAKEALEVIMRQATGIQKVEHVATHMALIKGKEALQTMLDSPIGKAMKDSGSWGKGLFDRLDGVAKAELSFGEAKGISGALARYFYVTHLGLNLGSVTMNMMQPLLLASTYGGLPNVLKGYTQAFKELGGYISERVGTYGVKALTDDQHLKLINKHFKFSNIDGENLIQVGRDTFSTLDTISYKGDALGAVAKKESYFFDYPMKLFEKAEWLNRSVAAHSVENTYQAAGRNVSKGSADYYRMLSDVDEMVSATQFGGNTLNTPLAFQGVGPLGRVGNNPLFRQFLSFPLRSATALSYQSARLGDRGALKGITQDFIRGMGVSAIFYEAGKNTFGIDLSPGLFGASLTQAVGGERFFQDGNEYIPIPPVIDIPVNIVRGALDPGQRELLQNNIPRLVPGGIAISRAMGMLPNLPESPAFGLPGALQKTYVDFNRRTPEGMVPVFKADGTLVDYQSPGLLFSKMLGVDMGQFKQTADFDGFLLKNREQIVEYRRRAIQALLSNEIPKMQSIKQEFKRRYGMDLTISKEQLDDAMQNRLVSRTERILDRMPPELRPQFQQLAAGRAENLGVEAEAIAGADTARQRMQARKIGTLPLTPEQQQVMAQEASMAEAQKRSMESFQGY